MRSNTQPLLFINLVIDTLEHQNTFAHVESLLKSAYLANIEDLRLINTAFSFPKIEAPSDKMLRMNRRMANQYDIPFLQVAYAYLRCRILEVDRVLIVITTHTNDEDGDPFLSHDSCTPFADVSCSFSPCTRR